MNRRQPLEGSPHRDRHAAAWTEYPPHLARARDGISEEHETEPAEDAVEAIGGEVEPFPPIARKVTPTSDSAAAFSCALATIASAASTPKTFTRPVQRRATESPGSPVPHAISRMSSPVRMFASSIRRSPTGWICGTQRSNDWAIAFQSISGGEGTGAATMRAF
jgi:anti-sigma factor RsiW